MAASAKHRLGFREKLGLYALALLLIGAALLGYLWFALDRYESNTPESSVRRYLQETSAGQWETILRDAEADLSPLDRPEDYTAWLTEVYAGLPEEYTLVRTSGGEGQTYALMDGSREVSLLILTPAPAESGRSWQQTDQNGGGQNGQPQEQHRDPKREESENFLHQLKLGLLEQETAPV